MRVSTRPAALTAVTSVLNEPAATAVSTISAAFATEKDSASATAPAVKDFIAFIENLRQRGWILYRYLSHNGRGAPLDHRCSRIKFEAASTARSGALYRAPTLALIGSYFGEITGNGKNARVRR